MNPHVLIGIHRVHLNEIIGDQKIYQGHFCKEEEVDAFEKTSKGQIILRSIVMAGDNSDLKMKL